MSLATPEAFAQNPSLVWQFYHYRREKCVTSTEKYILFLISIRARKAEPNAAHTALALLSIPSQRKVVAPDATFSVITQNVDGNSSRTEHILTLNCSQTGLSVKAMDKVLEKHSNNGISPLLEMHGRIFDVKCTSKSCKHVEYNTSSPICPALAGAEDAVEAGSLDLYILTAELPRCSKCNALARPGVVWFGEQPKELDTIDKLVEAADLCLVVGTSSTVSFACLL